ncbi:hypothetical protein SY86_00790 [Erwinia tracheiphila]|uniref:Uncharacterized protein n=1 Tax=Erwinia tracheiphila TaxID=65700 RepID=A0A0M2KGK6_9GAMM|nr:basic endochitinase [Erwinia tracheiphila PSU-1]KKF38094.1 hypothetical protein SY86_00790 [Erwinia tracheiphila]
MTLPQSELDQTEAKLTSGGLMGEVKVLIATLDNATVEKITAGSSTNPENVRRVENIIDAQRWEHLFPQRNPT